MAQHEYKCQSCFHRDVCPEYHTETFSCVHHLDEASVAPRAEWISVEERVPDAETPVLVFTKKGSFYVGYYYKAVTNPGFTGFYADCAKRDVTHWMPLPEPPKGG